MAVGFESFIAWWVTINKNVDGINYIYYNQQRFINNTCDGFSGIHKQVDNTSLIAWQNSLALDMLLAEKGDVCKIFGNLCCTFIPNNNNKGTGRTDHKVRRAGRQFRYHRSNHKMDGRYVWEMGKHPTDNFCRNCYYCPGHLWMLLHSMYERIDTEMNYYCTNETTIVLSACLHS